MLKFMSFDIQQTAHTMLRLCLRIWDIPKFPGWRAQ